MKKLYYVICSVCFPIMVFAGSTVTDDEIFTLIKAVGCFGLFLLLPGIVIGIICTGIRIIRGIFNI